MDWNLVVRSEYKKLQEEREILASNVWDENCSFLQNSTNATRSGQCDWNVELTAPLKLSRGSTVCVKSFVKSRTKLQVIRKHLLPVVDRPPHNVTWLPIPRNIPMKTLQSKTYIPFLGNEAVDSGFVDDLMGSIECDDDNSRNKDIMDDEMFVKLVDALAQHQQRNDNTVTSLVVPEKTIFLRICETFPELNRSADSLCERYQKFTKRAPCRPNIDEPMNEALDRTAALTSFYKLFCPKCLIYSCPFHCHENGGFVPKLKTSDVEQLKPFDRPCSNECYMIKNTANGDGSSSSDDVTSNAEGEWTGSELTMLRVLATVFPKNFCVIAETIRSKSCREVHRQLKLSNDIKPIRAKKVKVTNRGWRTQDGAKVYHPCNHDGPCNETNCSCINCEKFCNCDADCKYRTRMTCNCKKSCATQSCLCIKLFRECDPDHCTCVSCQNVNIQRHLDKKMHVATSDIHGWGLFVDEDCQKGDYIAEYKGEIISIEEADRRAKLCVKENSTYMFTLNNEFVIDAMHCGGKFRFVNFSRQPNCVAKILRVNGDHRIGIYAQRFIQAGEELTLDYLTIDPTDQVMDQ